MSDKKDNVIKVATELFAKIGFDKTSMAQICKEANVSKGLIYHHFESKEAILLEIFTASTNKMLEKNIANSYISNPVDELKQLINNVFYQLENDKLFFQFNLNILFQPSTKYLLEDQIRKRGAIIFTSTKAIFDKINPSSSEVLTYTFIAEIDGIALNYLSVFNEYPLKKMQEVLINKYNSIK